MTVYGILWWTPSANFRRISCQLYHTRDDAAKAVASEIDTDLRPLPLYIKEHLKLFMDGRTNEIHYGDGGARIVSLALPAGFVFDATP